MKRELQNSADLAALSSVQVLNATSTANCTDASTTARTSATANMVTMAGALAGSDFNIVDCTRWDLTHWQPPNPTVDPTGLYVFPPNVAAGENANAMHIKLQKSIPTIVPLPFGGNSVTVASAEAVATTTVPTASFSVGSQLLRLDGNGNGLLPQLLQAVGVPANLTLLDYSGLANLSITPSGLLKQLGINPDVQLTAVSPTSAISAPNVSLGNLLTAAVSVLSSNAAGETGGSAAADNAVVASLSALSGAIVANPTIGALNINLFGSTPSSGLFGEITSGTRDGALNAQVSALGLVTAALGIATSTHAIQTSLNILGIQVQVGVVEPPSIGVGGVGTIADNAQVRLFIDIDTTKIPLVNVVLSALGTQVNLPIVIDLVEGSGKLTKLDCSQATRHAEITVTSTILHTCVGGNYDANTAFSTNSNCSTGSGVTPPVPLLKLLGHSVLTSPIDIAGLSTLPPPVLTFDVDSSGTMPPPQSTPQNPAALGTMVQSLTNAAFSWLDNLFTSSAQPQTSDQVAAVASALATQYLTLSEDSSGKYNIVNAWTLIQTGMIGGVQTVPALPSWNVTVNTCGPLFSCPTLIPVKAAFTNSVNGVGNQSLIGGLFNGLGLTSCTGVLNALLGNYNLCVQKDLASYLQTAPTGLSGVPGLSGAITGAGSGSVCGILCASVNTLVAPLNQLGTMLESVWTNLLGLDVGETEVTLLSLTCAKPRLVY
jgi:uncharacterized membrane protein